MDLFWIVFGMGMAGYFIGVVTGLAIAKKRRVTPE